MHYHLHTPPFNPSFYDDYIALSETAFGHSVSEKWIHGVKWRLETMPDLTVCLAKSDEQLIGYKVGYATAYNRYYSWICLLYTSPSPRDQRGSRMPSSA